MIDFKHLLTSTPKSQTERKAWSIGLNTVWVPFFTATNTAGESAIPSEALGAPLRLAYDKTGSVRFGKSGKPVIRVAKELSESIRVVREQITAELLGHVAEVEAKLPDEFRAEVESARTHGMVITNHDNAELAKAVQAKAQAEADAILESSQVENVPTQRKELVPA